jgi:hypothetical protein
MRCDDVEDEQATGYDEGLESGDPTEVDTDLGDGIQDGTSNTFIGGGH